MTSSTSNSMSKTELSKKPKKPPSEVPIGIIALQTVLNYNAFTKKGFLIYFDHLSSNAKIDIYRTISERMEKIEKDIVEERALELKKIAHKDWKPTVDGYGEIFIEIDPVNTDVSTRHWCFYFCARTTHPHNSKEFKMIHRLTFEIDLIASKSTIYYQKSERSISGLKFGQIFVNKEFSLEQAKEMLKLPAPE